MIASCRKHGCRTGEVEQERRLLLSDGRNVSREDMLPALRVSASVSLYLTFALVCKYCIKPYLRETVRLQKYLVGESERRWRLVIFRSNVTSSSPLMPCSLPYTALLSVHRALQNKVVFGNKFPEFLTEMIEEHDERETICDSVVSGVMC